MEERSITASGAGMFDSAALESIDQNYGLPSTALLLFRCSQQRAGFDSFAGLVPQLCEVREHRHVATAVFGVTTARTHGHTGFALKKGLERKQSTRF
jgi:hypothetical protein